MTHIPGHKVRIVADGPDFQHARVWIDGTEIDYLMECKVRIAVAKTSTVSLEFEPEELDIEVLTRTLDKEVLSEVPEDLVVEAPDTTASCIEAEESVLGAMLVSAPAVTRVIEEVGLTAEDFCLLRRRILFTAIRDIHAASKPVHELSVTEALVQRGQLEEAGGRHYISELAAKVPGAGNAKHYAEIVQKYRKGVA